MKLKERMLVGITAVTLISIHATVQARLTDIGISGFGGGFKTESATVEKHGVGDGGWFWGLGFDTVFNNRYVVNAGLSFLKYEDKGGFQQLTVEKKSGKISLDSSSLRSMGGYLETGYRQPLAGPLFIGLNGGYYYVRNAERSIDDCSNCHSEEVPIGGGLVYVTPTAGLAFRYFKLELSYRLFMNSGSMDNLFQVSLAWMHRPQK